MNVSVHQALVSLQRLEPTLDDALHLDEVAGVLLVRIEVPLVGLDLEVRIDLEPGHGVALLEQGPQHGGEEPPRLVVLLLSPRRVRIAKGPDLRPPRNIEEFPPLRDVEAAVVRDEVLVRP